MRANLDEFAKSDLMRAVQHDVRMFGEDAFIDHNEGKD